MKGTAFFKMLAAQGKAKGKGLQGGGSQKCCRRQGLGVVVKVFRGQRRSMDSSYLLCTTEGPDSEGKSLSKLHSEL